MENVRLIKEGERSFNLQGSPLSHNNLKEKNQVQLENGSPRLALWLAVDLHHGWLTASLKVTVSLP